MTNAVGLDFVQNELALLGELQVGSEQAFEALVQLYQASIYNIAYRILGDPAEAADATQDTFMKTYKGIKAFRGECGLKTWIYRIAISESLNRQRWWRRRGRKLTVSLDATRENEDGYLRFAELPDWRLGPEDRFSAKETENAVQGALNNLGLKFRIVVVLRDIEGLSYEEISEALRLSMGTVKSRLWRGRLELKKQLQNFVKEGRGSSK